MGWEFDIKSDYSAEHFKNFLEKSSVEEISCFSKLQNKSGNKERISEFVVKFFEEHQDKQTDHLLLKAFFLLNKEEVIPQIVKERKIFHVDHKLNNEALKFSLKGKENWRIQQLKGLGIDLNSAIKAERTALHIACRKGNHALIEDLLKQGADPSVKDEVGNTPLHLYLRNKDPPDLEILKQLLLGCKADQPNGNNKTPLHYACQYKHKEAALELANQLDHSTQINDNIYDILTFAFNMKESDEKFISLLISKGASTAITDNLQGSLLHRAIRGEQSIDVIKLLIEHKVPLNEKDFEGRTPLFKAIAQEKPDLELIDLLLNSGADVNARDEDENTPLFLAVKSKSHAQTSDIIRLLIQHKASLDEMDERGRTPLLSAIAHRNPNLEVINTLITLGADVNVRDKDKNPPLFLALKNKPNLDVIKILIENGASVRPKNDRKMSILKYAIKNKLDDEIVQLLISSDKKIDAQDKSGNTILHSSIVNNNPTAVQLLLNRGAKINIPNNKGRTASWLLDSYSIPYDSTGANKDYDKEYGLRLCLSQFWNLDWITSYGEKEIKLKGAWGFFGEKEAFRLFDTFMESSASDKQDFDTIKKGIDNAKKTDKEINELYKKGKLLSFNTGWEGHSINVTIKGDYLLIGNRGVHSKKSTIMAFKIDQKEGSLSTEDIAILKKKLRLKPDKANKYFYKKLPKKLGYDFELDMDLVAQFIEKNTPLKDQLAGNCWWKSPLLGIFSSLLLDKFSKLDAEVESKREREIAYQKVFNEIQILFRQFTEYTHVKIAEEYMKQPPNTAERDHQLIRQVVRKIENKNWRYVFEMNLINKVDFFKLVEQYKETYHLGDDFEPLAG